MHSNKFPKRERLCSHYLIEHLFQPGHNRSFTAYPLRAVYSMQEATGDNPRQLLISVPKRQFKHAVDRNRVKRQIREAYRANRDVLNVAEGQSLLIAFIWLDNKHYPSSVINAKVHNLLTRISEA